MPVKSVGAEVLTISPAAERVIFTVIVILVPAAMLALGIVVFFKRRNM